MKPLPLMALAAAFLAMPAQAHDDIIRDVGSGRTGQILTDPAQQERLAENISAMMAALMNINIGPLADVIARTNPNSSANDLPADATLGEIVGRDANDARMMGDQVRAGTRMAGAAASVLGAYLPVLKDMASDVAAQMERNMRDAAK
ncbi:MAG TPA: hypothetical protein VFG34_10200 [Sphingopyxis sp.]|nr:hypothetical protein [Sphingopyxis sp.]